MASRVLSIDKEDPQHWDYAVEHGFWDLRTWRPIKAGEIVYFWQSKASFVGRVEATEDIYEIDASSPAGPWDDWPGDYTGRFHFRVLNATSPQQPRWGEVSKSLSDGRAPNFAPLYVGASDEAVLASYFGTTAAQAGSTLVDADYSDQERERDLKKFGYDLRRYTMRAIAMREGQPEFRRGLLTAYRSRCAITGTSAAEVLEAAHISPFKGGQSHQTHNGLLLRADIHTLFDRFLITVLPEHTVRVSPTLWGTDYGDLDGGQLVQVPTSRASAPDRDLLRGHNTACDWLRSGAAQRV